MSSPTQRGHDFQHVHNYGGRVHMGDGHYYYYAKDHSLDHLVYVEDAEFLSTKHGNKPLCTEGTRADGFLAMERWAGQSDPLNIFWLCGMPGTGKSTIVRTAFERWTERGGIERLCASFTFERGVVDDAQHLFTTLASRLARDQPLRSHISAGSRNDRNVSKTALGNQFTTLLYSPIMEARRNGLEEPVFLFIDALDQCSNTDQLRKIFEIALSSEARKAQIRFIITSRPEEPLYSLLNTGSLCLKLDPGYRPKNSTNADLRLLYKAQMPDLEADDLDFLVEEAEGSFVFAAQTCLFLVEASRSSLQKPAKLLARQGPEDLSSTSQSPYNRMDAIYEEVLTACLSRLNGEDRRVWIHMLHLFITAAEAHEKLGFEKDYWSFVSTAGYRGMHTPNSYGFRRSMRSLVRFCDERADFIHSTFPAYLRDKLRNSHEELRMDSPQIHKFFVRISATLAHEASQQLSSKKVSLQRRHVNRRTRYACMHWLLHFELVRDQEYRIRRLRSLATAQANSLLYSTSVILLLEGQHACKEYLARLKNLVEAQQKASTRTMAPHSQTKQLPKDLNEDLRCLSNSLNGMQHVLDTHSDTIEKSPSEFWGLYYRLPTRSNEIECNHRTCIVRARWNPLCGTQAPLDRPLQLRPPKMAARLSGSSFEGSGYDSELFTGRPRRFSGRTISFQRAAMIDWKT